MIFFVGMLLVACVSSYSDVPTISISSPANEVEVRLGERVLVQSVAQDDREIAKIELWGNGRLYQVNRPGKNDNLTSFDVIQIWDASSLGAHTLMVKAHDVDGQVSLPSSVVVNVLPPLPTPTPAPTVEPTSVVDPECKPSARFVEDVTVPDDSLYNSGVRFTKTWRLRNDGECFWEPGTEWVFISGMSMNAQSPTAVELAEPGRIVDVSVDMVAPDAPGSYTGYWRLRRPNGDFFGDQAYVRIIVP
ncbi:MAG: hypothetical protein JW934_20090 [Anaerolineae bacterium]|nr:hypothetical protein [Anaerolineae bacterium]